VDTDTWLIIIQMAVARAVTVPFALLVPKLRKKRQASKCEEQQRSREQQEYDRQEALGLLDESERRSVAAEQERAVADEHLAHARRERAADGRGGDDQRTR
jgi:hypothetical protein